VVENRSKQNGTRINDRLLESLGDTAPVGPGDVIEIVSEVRIRALAEVGPHADTVPVPKGQARPTSPPATEPVREEATILFASEAMRAVVARIEEFAVRDAAVLLCGPTGVGKELLARHVHDASPRRAGPFVTMDCTTISEDLFESEVFGHKKGSFTGAVADHVGLALTADGGTLFLDEIGDLPASQQGKLLRLLEKKEVRRVGAKSWERTNVRLVAATHRNLEQLVSEGKFRQDLYHRLAALSISIPPLAERPEDVRLLANVFLERASGKRQRFSAEALELLERRPWPGNVRQLQNVIELVTASLSTDREIGRTALEALLGGAGNTPSWIDVPADRPRLHGEPILTLAEAEALHIRRALLFTNGNQTVAAELLGIDRKTLGRKFRALPGRENVARLPSPENRRDAMCTEGAS
jgi:DNA-binding NtrC family response regulator